MKILSIQGPPAVGKTTLLKKLVEKTKYDVIVNSEIFEKEKKMQIIKGYDLKSYSDFLKNQQSFFSCEYRRWQRVKDLECQALLFDRGPENTICFSYVYPRAINATWNIDSHIPTFIKKYILRESDQIIYLYADKLILEKRKSTDLLRERKYFETIMQYYELELEYYGKKENVEFIDTTCLSAEDVVAKCEKILIATLEEG